MTKLRLMDDPDWTLLGRVLGGDCTPEEAEAVARWAAHDPAHARLLEFARTVWGEAGTPRADLEAGWRAMREKMAAGAPSDATVVRPFRLTPAAADRPRRFGRRSLLLAAAAASVAGVGALGWWRHERAEPAVATGGAREYATTRGQQAQVTLVDGTRVWLNVDSRLTVPHDYGVAARDVALEGEAYFVVEHDARRPFRVRTRGAVSEDLGTEFNVRAYPDDAGVVVVVASGRVALRPDGTAGGTAAGVELGRGQMGRLGVAGDVAVTDVDLTAVLGWRERRLELEERPLAEVLREVGRWYDLEIALEDSALGRVPVTISLSQHTADEALAVLTGVVDARYRRDGRQVRIYRR
jgi:transmembrane sensor